MLLVRMSVGDRVNIQDTSGNYIGEVQLIRTRDGRHATGIDLPKEYQLKFVKAGKTAARVVQSEVNEWEVPEEAWNEC